MDDIASKISELLKDPNTIQQLGAILGQNETGASKDTSSNSNTGFNMPDANTINTLLGALGQNTNNENNQNNSADSSPDTAQMAGMMMQIAPLLSSLKQDDNSSNLLTALRPFLSEPRRKKLDESSKMLQLMRLLPLLKDTGILESFFK